MFKKILIANRGEIAVRIMATCREMGIATVAVYSQADRHARHVREADEAYELGPAPATESYLCIEKIIAVARTSGAEAVHPGYGFLSENAAFVEACEAEDLIFVGPPAAAMRLMGSKIAAKTLAESVDAPTIPGYKGDVQEPEVLLAEARELGFPLLIKASAGGGGKGMRVVEREENFLTGLEGARREALGAFGDATVFLERLVTRPRHIEIQVLGDRYGNLVHLGERECSIQRRHQKIVEESPSVALTPELRAEMGATAVRIARAAGYVNAGTLEFMLDADGHHFYFLEMNTRLQVEHPVTELVTGFDLVRHQLLIAAGERLTLQQEEITPRGHAIEVRLYAEDPAQNFLPSTGTVVQFNTPSAPGMRVDSGIASGDEISQYYDPMLAKLIVYGENRLAAIARLQQMLAQTVVFGVTTNLSLLQSIAEHPAFSEGATSTGFLDDYRILEDLEKPGSVDALHLALQAAALIELTGTGEMGLTGSPWKTLGPWRTLGGGRQTGYTYQGESYRIVLRPVHSPPEIWEIQINDLASMTVQYTREQDHLVLLQHGQHLTRTWVLRTSLAMLVQVNGRVFALLRQQPPTIENATSGGGTDHQKKSLTAPMAGTIVKVHVSAGEQVEQRQVLLILTAMKMEHTIIAPHTGIVKQIHYKEGDVVKGGATLIEIE